jgi:hypothetical protein
VPIDELVSLLLLNPAVLMGLIGIAIFAYRRRQYRKSAYFCITHHPYFEVRRDRGKHAEYLTYKALSYSERQGGMFLFNTLIPKERDGSTEIDVILICPKGLFVFECKNYSGWIFGNEAQKKWTQTLPKGRGRPSHKEQFYNPIMQNAEHIRHLKNLIGQNVPMHSVIVFSDECTLKNITLRSTDVQVINLRQAGSTIAKMLEQSLVEVFSASEVADIYSKLYPYTQLGADAREQHIAKVRRDFGSDYPERF